MQLVTPIDIEDALRTDLAALKADARFFAPPIPPDLKANDVLIERLGGGRITGVSHEYDVSIDCYADNDAEAVALSNAVHGLFVSLPVRATSTQYSASNYDPRAPELSRQTFRASVICPGNRINF